MCTVSPYNYAYSNTYQKPYFLNSDLKKNLDTMASMMYCDHIKTIFCLNNLLRLKSRQYLGRHKPLLRILKTCFSQYEIFLNPKVVLYARICCSDQFQIKLLYFQTSMPKWLFFCSSFLDIQNFYSTFEKWRQKQNTNMEIKHIQFFKAS